MPMTPPRAVPSLDAHAADGGAEWTLAIEASTAAGSVALFRAETCVQRRDVAMGVSNEDALFPAVLDVLRAEGMSPRDVTAVVCGSGPGSFTSLRIAASVAKGLAHGTGASLYAVPSLLLAAAAHDVPGRYLVHADALRGERYAVPVTIDDAHHVHADAEMVRVPVDAVDALADARPQLVVSTADGVQSVRPDAAHLMRVHEWSARGRVSLDAWEPVYGRLAEAQVKWEATHQQTLPANG